ncbi:2-oxoglutarate dehydrogenase E1 component [Sphaerisporangium sp. NPDC088356]|uniref:2-oxoglutarate dehydrogenase E1 component n=1 Tax=Sphaerisporangium sp. NPDC088356 TaxID=3154871 RepID=UPI00342AA8FE
MESRLLRGRDAALARNMEASLTVPTASTVRTFNVDRLVSWRAGHKKAGRPLQYAAVIGHALVRTLVEDVPAMRHRLERDDAGTWRVDDQAVHLGVAVDLETEKGRTILVPVIRDADQMTFTQFRERLEALVQACRSGRVDLRDLSGANIIMTSTGRFGSTSGIPRLPVGPGSIVAVGTIGVPPGLELLANSVPVSPVVTVTSTYDHRVIQGGDSGAFLSFLQGRLQSADFYAALDDELTPAASADNPAAKLAPARVRHRGAAGAEPSSRISGPGRVFDGVEIEAAHLPDPDARAWFDQVIAQADDYRPTPDARRSALTLLARLDSFERFLQRQFLGQKTLSVEGLDTSVVLLAEIAEQAAAERAESVFIGMAHRGRLSIMAHVLNWPYERILREFLPDALPPDTSGSGDVRQHLGGAGRYRGRAGNVVDVYLEENPSHLEFVSPVALGAVRAVQDDMVRRGIPLPAAQARAMPVLFHGDAAFTGQGVVYETLNLHALDAYTVGGAVHVIQDNRLGFTAGPGQLRSTGWPTDVVRGFGIPVLHVDADDVDGALTAARIAHRYRRRFGRDIAVHVLGYRRLGHNESDEPRYTQPLYYRTVDQHPRVAELYETALVADRAVSPGRVRETQADTHAQLASALADVKADPAGVALQRRRASPVGEVASANLESWLAQADEAWVEKALTELESPPEGFATHPKLRRQFERARQTRQADSTVDWAQGELLALRLISEAGVPVRLTGEDCERGTFSQRHAVLHDELTGERWQRLQSAHGPILVANSPLTEVATVGYEYGYARTAPHALVLWEAQFGDFGNVAQVIFDQFVMAGREKWSRDGRLALLLPHGWEGAGPEHSSARLERFLTLCARNNASVLNPTTAKQYFAALVSAALNEEPAPTVIMTPKSLLRSESARSTVQEFVGARYEPVLAYGCAREEARRLVLCSGKIGAELAPLLAGAPGVRLLRLERLYPFPRREIARELAGCASLSEVVWVQEEPENMGAWRYVAHELLKSGMTGPRLGYVGRPEASSPAEGYHAAHVVNQERLRAAAVRLGTADYWLVGSAASS